MTKLETFAAVGCLFVTCIIASAGLVFGNGFIFLAGCVGTVVVMSVLTSE